MKTKEICTRCVIDTSDPDVTFDQDGVCNYCLSFDEIQKSWNLPQVIADQTLEKTFQKIKSEGAGKDFDCIVGLSGGVDSSYVALLAKEHGLRPLCIHLDNGWNSELAVANIHNIVSKLGFDLYTHVIDWDEFKDLQRSFFKADVVDIEVLTDHAIFGVILQQARKHKIKYILSGANLATEATMPKSWVHRKQDLTNIVDIQKRYGTTDLKTFPQVSTIEHVFAMYALGYKIVKPLNMINYDKSNVKSVLIEKLGWRDYGGKHYESIFTKFYQAHILPTKFNIDKRRAHLSTLICSGQMTRTEALKELALPLYNEADLEQDAEYVRKKLGFTENEFRSYLSTPGRSHYEFKSDQYIFDFLNWIKTRMGRKAFLSN